MPFWRLYYHLIWATKRRARLIQPPIDEQLYGFLVARADELDVQVYAINGWHDHVHLVVSVPPTMSIADVVKHLKGTSAHFMNDAGTLPYHFAWQPGYGAMSVGERQREIAEAYVREQKQHHSNKTTNNWLEYCGDEAPAQDDVSAQSLVREEIIPYEAWGSAPF